MTRVDFYVAPDKGADARLSVAARLAEKAHGRGHRIFINAGDEAQARALNAALWTSRPASFIPHDTVDSDPGSPVTIGWGQDPGEHHDVLINLAATAPAFFSRFERVAEIVTQDKEQLAQLREAWRFYRDRGYPLQKHDL